MTPTVTQLAGEWKDGYKPLAEFVDWLDETTRSIPSQYLETAVVELEIDHDECDAAFRIRFSRLENFEEQSIRLAKREQVEAQERKQLARLKEKYERPT